MDDMFNIFNAGNVNDKLRFMRDRKIGVGIKYPLQPSNTYKKDLAKVSSIYAINQSIYIILSTRVGERFFLPEFGTRLYEYLFEPNTYIVKDLVRDEILRCLKMWEQRIENIQVTVTDKNDEGNYLICTIDYKVKDTMETGSFVYPINTDIYEFGKEVTNETLGK